MQNKKRTTEDQNPPKKGGGKSDPHRLTPVSLERELPRELVTPGLAELVGPDPADFGFTGLDHDRDGIAVLGRRAETAEHAVGEAPLQGHRTDPIGGSVLADDAE